MLISARRGALVAAAVLASAAGPTAAQSCPDASALTRGLSEPLATVRYLSDDALEGRLAGSPGERCAAEFIAARFRSLGLQPGGTDGTFFQDVPLASAVNPHAAAGSGRNVIAVLAGADGGLRAEVVIIGAHYDHLGLGGAGSMTPGERAVHNGADDNASGVAALLHAAELLSSGPRPARPIVFVAFTGEESGLLGSAHFTRTPTIPLSGARAMLNMDMVGRLGADPLIVYGTGTATEWPALLEPHATALGLEIGARPEGYGPSDHTSFYIQDMPVLHFFTNTHADYHRPTDDWERIDAAGLERVATLVARLAAELAAPQTRLSLQRGVGQPQPRAGSAGSGAWLGTVPDFAPVERGVLLGGVTPGSPGEAAGLRKGDVLIRLGDHAVNDLQAFTDALRAHKPGDEVEVVVLREGQEVRLRARLGTRGT